MNIQLFLFKDNDCDLCKVMQQELTDNPPKCDSTIICAKHAFGRSLCKEYSVKTFPTIVLIDDDKNKVISKWEGYIDCDSINNKIEEYERYNKM